jgi:hypothetical protein
MSWRQTVEKAGDAPNFTKPLLPLKAKGLFIFVLFHFSPNFVFTFQ